MSKEGSHATPMEPSAKQREVVGEWLMALREMQEKGREVNWISLAHNIAAAVIANAPAVTRSENAAITAGAGKPYSHPVVTNVVSERDHGSNDKPSESPKPLNCDPDARRWAREFMEVWNKNPVMDEGWMISWFANAIMCGDDTCRWRMERELSTARSADGASIDTLDWNRLRSGDRRALNPENQPLFDRFFAQSASERPMIHAAWRYRDKHTGQETLTHQPPDRTLFLENYEVTELFAHDPMAKATDATTDRNIDK